MIEGGAPYGSASPAVDAAMRRAIFCGMPVVRASRGNAEGFVPVERVPLGIAAGNLTATKARILLMACLLRFGGLPPAGDPDDPTTEELEATRAALRPFQEVSRHPLTAIRPPPRAGSARSVVADCEPAYLAPRRRLPNHVDHRPEGERVVDVHRPGGSHLVEQLRHEEDGQQEVLVRGERTMLAADTIEGRGMTSPGRAVIGSPPLPSRSRTSGSIRPGVRPQ